MNDEPRWPAAWVRAALELAILGSLAPGPVHGYAVAQVLQERGFGRLRGGSLYPALARLQESGAIEATWVEGAAGPGRKDYRLTVEGRVRLDEGLAAWRELTDTLDTDDER